MISWTIAPVAVSAIRMRPGPEVLPVPPGDFLVKARNLPSGENVGSVSQSFGPRPASGIGAACDPSASASQISSILPFGESLKRVKTIRRPSGV